MHLIVILYWSHDKLSNYLSVHIIKNMRKPIYILSTVFVLISMSCSYKTYKSIANNGNMENITAPQEDGAVQEPAWTYYERLSHVFSADSSCVGITDDMDFPDWYSGCFVNDRDRLTINVIGDTLRLRSMLTELLGGNEFDLGVGVCSMKEHIKTRELLDEAISRNYNKIAKGNLTSGSNPDGTINICIQGENDSIIDLFRRLVFDSPILRFKVAQQVGIMYDFEVVDIDEKAYVTHELPPQFPGGDSAMLNYIYDNLRYPKEAYIENIQGRVVVQFLVDKTGIIDSVKIVKSKDSYLDNEALRIIKSFPRLISGKFDLTPIDQWMTLPIMFKLSDYNERKNKKYLAFKYDNGDDPLKDGLYRIVDQRGKIGYADEQGNTVITPRFVYGFPFENGKARVADYGEKKEVEGSNGECHYWESDGWYYIDKTGRKLEN